MTSLQLRHWIVWQGISDREAARRIGCSRSALADWLNGVTPIPPYIGLALSALANGLQPWQPD